MNEILNLNINEMAQTEFDCSCGRHHNFEIHDLAVGPGAIQKLPEFAAPFKDGQILMVYDNNTFKAAGKQARDLLTDAGFNIKELYFDRGSDILIPDESVVGRILQEIEADTKLIIAVGGGSLNDSCKYVTCRTKMPYMIVGTAPSMDGYVSDGAPLMSAGRKISYPAHLAYAVICDTDIMKLAPQELIQAGFGDVVGKITALTDWDLSVKVTGEYRCETTVELVRRALNKCFEKSDQLPQRDGDAINALIEALILTGVAMALVRVSRPASGAEHMLSHYWEMDYIARGLNPIHHGTQVGYRHTVIARFFEKLSDILPEGTGQLCPPHEEIEKLLRDAGAPVTPKDIGISKELFHASLMEGYKVRPRYSVLKFAMDNGRLEQIADEITTEIYG
ncbi:MAG: sn-glycerol-1-phosphate dehydrogenase [Catenisphaera adipataccumulans]|jgi:glycerol-1-phosphate dehydrogenase [NAD(P)+]|uniref:sn-glycerol-1-phosphate dehydrogenase n=1 Tax=Catenisphaera adipataccumulans TaxID=700500 RepID=UPI003D9061E9